MKKKNFVYYTLPKIINVGFSFLLLPIYTKFLDPTHYGIIALMVIIFELANSFTDIGAAWILAQNFHKSKFNIKELTFHLISLDFIFKLTIFAGLFLIFPGLKTVLPEIAPYITVFTILNVAYLLSFLNSTALSYLILAEDAKIHFIGNLGGYLIYPITLITCLFFFNLKVESLAFGILTQNSIFFLVYLFYLKDKITPSINRQILNEIKTIGIPASLKTASSNIIGNADRFLMQQVVSTSALGLYSFAKQLRSLYDLFAKSFSRIYSAYFFKHFENITDKEHSRIFQYWLWFNFILSSAIILFIPNIISLLTHGKFTHASIFVQLLFIESFILSYTLFFSNTLVIKKKTKFISLVTVALGVIGVGMQTLFLNLFGEVGSPVATISISAITLTAYLYSCKNMEDIQLNHNVFLSLLLGLLALFGLRLQLPETFELTPFIILSLVYSLSFIFFLFKSNVFKPETLSLLKQRLKLTKR